MWETTYRFTGNKLYAVVNCSCISSRLDVRTARAYSPRSRFQTALPVFKGRYAYVSSYAGPVQIDPNARIMV